MTVFVATSKRFYEEAEVLVKNGDYEQGITILEKSTDKLSRALRVSGVSF